MYQGINHSVSASARYRESQITDEWIKTGMNNYYDRDTYTSMYYDQHPDLKAQLEGNPEDRKNLVALNPASIEKYGARMYDGVVTIPTNFQSNGAEVGDVNLQHMNTAIKINVRDNDFEAFNPIGNPNHVKCVTSSKGNPFELSNNLNEVNKLNPDLAERLRASISPQALNYSEYTMNFLEDAAYRNTPDCDRMHIGDLSRFNEKYAENPEATMRKLEQTVGVVAQSYIFNEGLSADRTSPNYSSEKERMMLALDTAAESSEMFAKLKESVYTKQLDCKQRPLQPSNGADYGNLTACVTSAGVRVDEATKWIESQGVKRPTMEYQQSGLSTRLVESKNITEQNAEVAAKTSAAYSEQKPTKSLTPKTVDNSRQIAENRAATNMARYNMYQSEMYKPTYDKLQSSQNFTNPAGGVDNTHSEAAEALRAKYGSQNKSSSAIQQAMLKADNFDKGPSGPDNDFQP